MVSTKRIITAAATFAIAGGAGYISQNGDALAARFSGDLPMEELNQSSTLDRSGNVISSAPTLPIEAVLPDGFQARTIAVSSRVAASSASVPGDTLTDVPAPVFFAATCEVTLSALPEAGAMVSLKLDAPCYQNQRIEISHAGLTFADATDAGGLYSVQVPALFEYEPFTVDFIDGRSVEAKTLMLTIDEYKRAAMIWEGTKILHIHALEQGAEFGGAGHVWAEAPSGPEAGVEAKGGFLTELGNPDILNPRLAEVYSFPVGRGEGDNSVELFVEAEIDGRSCGTELAGAVLQVSASGAATTSDLSLVFPPCGEENGFLVLKDLLLDLKIASN